MDNDYDEPPPRQPLRVGSAGDGKPAGDRRVDRPWIARSPSSHPVTRLMQISTGTHCHRASFTTTSAFECSRPARFGTGALRGLEQVHKAQACCAPSGRERQWLAAGASPQTRRGESRSARRDTRRLADHLRTYFRAHRTARASTNMVTTD